jgi:(2Fe-2S) ferredoxin
MVYDLHIFVCTNQRTGTEKRSCGEAHGLELVAEFKKQLKDLSLDIKVRANRCGCLGICDFGPTVAIYPEGTFYVGVEKTDIQEILRAHLFEKKRVERLLLKGQGEEVEEFRQLLTADLFTAFMKQLQKDLESAGLDNGITGGTTPDIERLKSDLRSLVESLHNDNARMGRLLNRVDIGEAQLRKYLEERPSQDYRDALVELIIKRILQKVVLRKKFSA